MDALHRDHPTALAICHPANVGVTHKNPKSNLFSSIYSEANQNLLKHVHFYDFTRNISELILVLVLVKEALAKNRFIIVQLGNLKQLIMAIKDPHDQGKISVS